MSEKDIFERVPSQLYSDFEVAAFFGKIEIDGFKGLTELDASSLKSDSPDADAKAHRFELITAVRSGRHVELSTEAQTFKQSKDPNRRYLRLGEDKLEARAPSWKGQPYLTDHNTWSMSASKGSILSSKAIQESKNVTTFQQKLHVVKPDAVIGVLDGTFNKFSIGWWAAGMVTCSVHGTDVAALDGCNCWPGDKVMLNGKEHTVEYVFSDYRGKETSSVVIPAVQDTSVGDVRAALAAELGINRTRPRKHKETKMLFPRLAAALGLAALNDGDEDAGVRAVEALHRRATTAEADLAATKKKLGQAETALEAMTASTLGVQVDALLEKDGYLAGKLRYGRDDDGKKKPSDREKRLRRIAKDDGIEALRAELAEMPVIVPLGQRPRSETAEEPERENVLGDDDYNENNPYLQHAAEQTGQSIKDLVRYANGHVKEVR